MKATTRTQKSVLNAQTAMAFYVVNLVLEFFSRRVFLDYLGTEVLGLNSTVASVLQLLNLAELGIGSAIAVTLYDPLAKGDRRQISEIVSLQGWLYLRVAAVVAGAAAVLVCFFGLIFAKAQVPGWYPYATFGVMLVGILGTYIFNYRQILLTADQQEWRVTVPYQTVRVCKVVLQIAFIVTWPRWGYMGWLALELVAPMVVILLVRRAVRRGYPWLVTDTRRGGELRRKYPAVMAKTRQIFFHKIGGFALANTTIPIIYAYASLTAAAIYGNYLLITQGVMMMVDAAYNSITAGLGNLVAEGNKSQIMKVFREFFTSRFLLAVVCCFGVWTLADGFITLWVGPEYLLSHRALALIVAILFVNLSRGAVNGFLYAYGLFHDVWAPIAEAVLNIGLAVLLGWKWGLEGILAGVLASLLVIVVVWKPYLLFRWGFHRPVGEYVAMYVKHLALTAVVFAAGVFLVRFIPLDPTRSWFHFAGYAAIAVGGFAVAMTGVLWLTERGMRDFLGRVHGLLGGGHRGGRGVKK